MPNLTVNTVGNGLAGGLGNQLFGIAIGLAKGWENDMRVFFKFFASPDHDYRKTLYRKIEFRNDEDISDYKNIKEPTPNAMIEELFKPLKKENTVISGYCQTALYFDAYRDRILQMLYLNPEERETVTRVVEKLKGGKKTVGMSMRISNDYETLKWALPAHYYTRALEEFKDYNVVIFTDEEEKTKKMFPDKFVFEESLYPAHVKMFIMSKMDGMIMSNSSYSWWSVYIGTIPKVIAPYPWYKNYTYNSNIYCKGWIKLWY